MAEITLRGNAIHTSGDLPAAGSDAPDFVLTKTDLSDVSKKDVAGKRVILNIFPSIDTPTCAASVRRFNEEASKLDNAEVLCVSLDLPFAHNRFRARSQSAPASSDHCHRYIQYELPAHWHRPKP